MVKRYRAGVASMVHDHVWGELKRWAELPNVDLVAAGDVNADLRDRIGTEFDVPRVYGSWQEMLEKEELDIVQAASGLVDLQARLSGGEPTYLATVVADKVTGLTGLYAILAALFARTRTGEGQEVEVPMFETLVSFTMIEHLCGSLFDPPQGPPEYPRVTAAARRPYRTKDGHIGVMIYNDKHWRAFFHAIGDPEWTRDPMFASMRSRTQNIGTVLHKLAEVIEERTTAEWIELFRLAEVPAMAIATPADLLHDEHLEATGFWNERDSEFGRLRFPGIPTRFSATPGAIGDPGPALGADSRAILEEAGFDATTIDALVAGANRVPA